MRANLAEEFNKHDVHEAISSARDKITSVTQQKANGQSCNPANNTSIFECQGTCGAGNVCVSFCGKG